MYNVYEYEYEYEYVYEYDVYVCVYANVYVHVYHRMQHTITYNTYAYMYTSTACLGRDDHPEAPTLATRSTAVAF